MKLLWGLWVGKIRGWGCWVRGCLRGRGVDFWDGGRGVLSVERGGKEGLALLFSELPNR